MSAPYYFDYQNFVDSRISPSTVHCANTALVQYFTKYLLQKVLSVFMFDLPKTWNKGYTLYTLFCNGFFSVLNTDKFGVIPQNCTLNGYDIFYQPTNTQIANPLLTGILNPRIGVQCALVKLQPDYGNIMDLVSYYADMLALCAEAAGMSLVNSKMAYVLAADSKTAAESLKAMYDRIASGDPAVAIDKKLLNEDGNPTWTMFAQDVGGNYIVSDVLADMRKIENMFATDIGLPNANTDKRERLISDEVNANNVETMTRCDMWLETIREGFKQANEMFGLDLSVDWRVAPIATAMEEDAGNALFD